MTKETKLMTGTLVSTMDQLQAELDDMHRELTMLGMGLITLSLLMLALVWRSR